METCLTYSITNTRPDCVGVVSIFLSLCENNETNVDSSILDATDLTNLVSDDTFGNGTNVQNVTGLRSDDGRLGLLVTLTNATSDEFTICLGNITVNAANLDSFNLNTTDVGTNGTVFVNDPSVLTGNDTECPINGLPCFDFFFDAGRYNISV